MMNLERFATIVDAYGGSPARWPEAERASAVAFMRTSPEAQRLADEAEALDGLLDLPETAPVMRELQERILAQAPNASKGGARFTAGRHFRWPKWIPAAAVACSLALGIVTGTQVPRLMGLDDETLAIEAVSSAMTATAGDSEIFGGSE